MEHDTYIISECTKIGGIDVHVAIIVLLHVHVRARMCSKLSDLTRMDLETLMLTNFVKRWSLLDTDCEQ